MSRHVPAEVRRRFERWCQVPARRYGSAGGVAPKPAPAIVVEPVPAPPRRPRRAPAPPTLPPADPQVAAAVLDVLGEAPRALSTPLLRKEVELASGRRLPAARNGDDLLHRAAAHLVRLGQVRQADASRGSVHYLPDRGYVPGSGVFEEVLFPACLPVEATQARRRLDPLFPRGTEEDPLARQHLVSHPAWRLSVTWRAPRLLGLGEAQRRAVLVVDALDHLLLVPHEGRVRQRDDYRQGLTRARDWLASHDFRPTPPVRAGVLPFNYRRFAGQDEVRHRVERALSVEVEQADLVFLPFWVGVTTPYRSGARSVRCVDALLGGAFSPKVLPDVPT